MENLIQTILPIGLYLLGLVLAALIVFLVKKYVTPWISAKCELLRQQIGNEEYESLVEQIKTFMASAEVQLGAGTGADKSKMVIGWIKEIFPNIREDYVQALIDGFMKVLANEGIVHMKQK